MRQDELKRTTDHFYLAQIAEGIAKIQRLLVQGTYPVEMEHFLLGFDESDSVDDAVTTRKPAERKIPKTPEEKAAWIARSKAAWGNFMKIAGEQLPATPEKRKQEIKPNG